MIMSMSRVNGSALVSVLGNSTPSPPFGRASAGRNLATERVAGQQDAQGGDHDEDARAIVSGAEVVQLEAVRAAANGQAILEGSRRQAAAGRLREHQRHLPHVRRGAYSCAMISILLFARAMLPAT